ncbi:MAG: DUF1194 domain-containing protein [Verrucomicrobiaceae bacterium]|nr:MAG: DUF1194 domain-containing protein [Verrucomicrobiaceae bacterium]
MSPEATFKRIVLSALAGLIMSTAPCTGAAVDTELVLLVDAQTYSQSDFTLILESIAKSFEQQAFQEAVLGGTLGKMAASVILFNAPGEQVRVPWIQLSSTLDLNNFAQSVRSISYPNAGGNISYSSAINTAASQLASNQFQGSTRQITLIDDATGFWAADPAGTLAARNAALATSADVINAIVFDAQYSESAVNSFYGNNVVSPGTGNLAVVSTPQGGNKSLAQIQSVITSVVGTVSQPTVVATASVPESSSLILLGLGSFVAFRRRR